MTRKQNRIDSYNFEKVEHFKYLDTIVIADNNIRIRIDRCIYSLYTLLKSKTLIRISKVKIYKMVIWTILFTAVRSERHIVAQDKHRRQITIITTTLFKKINFNVLDGVATFMRDSLGMDDSQN